MRYVLRLWLLLVSFSLRDTVSGYFMLSPSYKNPFHLLLRFHLSTSHFSSFDVDRARVYPLSSASLARPALLRLPPFAWANH